MFFFFQAEDGIRDIGVTGVQTCALPISTILCRLCVIVSDNLCRTSLKIRKVVDLISIRPSVFFKISLVPFSYVFILKNKIFNVFHF